MAHFFKQNRFHGTTLFILGAIFILTVFSCRRECDCECNCDLPEPPAPAYWEHFIAHAGGQIDEIAYTNCLEALNLSYSKGCKLFELDLVLTTDEKIVAKHDPPGITEAEFMSRLILNKYTPLNMEAINNWFRNHTDAILITDKLNDPQKIYDEFLFRDRVIMELFTWEAVDKAIELGIKPMVSENLIFGKSEKAAKMGIPQLSIPKNIDIEQILEDKNIKHTCMSRYYCIKGNEDLLKRLKAKGIKNYVYHLELPIPISGISAEQYVWEYEMNYCYGMYANDLDLLESLLKSKN